MRLCGDVVCLSSFLFHRRIIHRCVHGRLGKALSPMHNLRSLGLVQWTKIKRVKRACRFSFLELSTNLMKINTSDDKQMLLQSSLLHSFSPILSCGKPSDDVHHRQIQCTVWDKIHIDAPNAHEGSNFTTCKSVYSQSLGSRSSGFNIDLFLLKKNKHAKNELFSSHADMVTHLNRCCFAVTLSNGGANQTRLH